MDFDPYEYGDREFNITQAKEFINTLKLPKKFEVRDYQYKYFVHAIKRGRAFEISPTGSGKSLIIYFIFRYYREKTLIVLPTTNLVHQILDDFKDYGYKGKSQFIYGKHKDFNPKISLTAINVNMAAKKDHDFFDCFDLLIGDEAHQWTSASFKEIMKYQGETKHIFGFTGTLDESLNNIMVLEGFFGKPTQFVTTRELIDQGFLAYPTIHCLILHYKKKTFNARNRLKVLASLEEKVAKISALPDTPENKLKIEELKNNIEEINNDKGFAYHQEIDYISNNSKRFNFLLRLILSKKTNSIVLYKNTSFGNKLYESLIKFNENVFIADKDTSVKERLKYIEYVKSHEGCVLLSTYNIFSTGMNIPNLQNVFFGQPHKGLYKVVQSIGRTLRLTETKKTADVYDICDDFKSANYSKKHFKNRMMIYNREQYPYKISNIEVKE